MKPPARPDGQRRALTAGALGWALGGLAPTARAQAAAAPPPLAPDAPWLPDEVEAGAYMLAGLPGAPGPANGGRVGNAGFVVGRSGVLAINSGSAFWQGQALLAAIAQVTPLPVRGLLLTHARQEFVFGAAAFQARGIPVHMHRQAAQLMASRCEGCLKLLRQELGDGPMAGTRVVKPDVLFDETHVIETIGRPVLVQVHGLASAPGDTSAFDVRTGTLFSPGLLDNRRIPDIQDGRIEAWRLALVGLGALRINTVVPGHGRAGTPELIAQVDRYLQRLEQRTAGLLKDNTALSDVADAANLPEFAQWDQYETIHRRNASIQFLRQERRLLLGDTTD